MEIKRFVLTFVMGFRAISSLSPYGEAQGGCSIKLFDDRDFKGEWEETSRRQGIPRFDMHEKSIQTFGRCCWRIFS